MRSTLLFFVVLVCGAYSHPFMEQETDFIDDRWTITQDGESHMRLIDLNPMEIEITPAFNAINDVFYILFTRSNPTQGQRISFDLDTLRSSNFRRNAPVRFMIHGWGSSSGSGENTFTGREFLARADQNVIIVDWSAGAGSPNYITARNRVAPTGEAIARFIDHLHENGFLRHEQVNIVGHSLGAHVAGLIGKNVRRGRIQAIYGTDPAGPLFTRADAANRLDSNDATYTEAIHTNAGTLGINEPITQASFFPNWGSSQPGCGIDLAGNCAHGRSTRLYAESVSSQRFVGTQCQSFEAISARRCPGTGVTGIMGGEGAKSIRGIFFLETNAASPFALN